MQKKKDIEATWNSWAKANKEWTVLGTVPYQHVSMYIQNLILLISANTFAIYLDFYNQGKPSWVFLSTTNVINPVKPQVT